MGIEYRRGYNGTPPLLIFDRADMKWLDYDEVTTTEQPLNLPNNWISPFGACRVIINEINSQTPERNTNQFVELKKVCGPKGRHRRTVLEYFQLLWINGLTSQVEAICSMKGESLKNRPPTSANWFYVVGNKDTTNVDFDFTKCESVKSDGFYPQGEEEPYALVLQQCTRSTVLDRFKLPIVRGVRQPLDITPDLKFLIRTHIQDIYVYGAMPRYTACSIFSELYEPYGQPKNYLLRDWQAIPNAKDLALSRCTVRYLPALPESFMYCKPTPGTENDCQNGFPFVFENVVDELPEFAFEEIVGTSPADETCTNMYGPLFGMKVAPEMYMEKMDQAATNNQVDVNMEISVDEEMEVDAEILAGQVGTLTDTPVLPWNDVKQFQDKWIEDITTYQSDLIDLDVVRKPSVMWWLEYIYSDLGHRYNSLRCRICYQSFEDNIVVDKSQRSSRSVITTALGYLREHGTNAKTRNSEVINSHVESNIHAVSTQYQRLKTVYQLRSELDKVLEETDGPHRDFFLATDNVVSSVLHLVKLGAGLTQITNHFNYLRKLKVKVGSLHHNTNSATQIIEIVSANMHSILVEALKKWNKPFSMMLDGSEDISGIPYLGVMLISSLENDRLSIYLYKVIELEVEHTGEAIFELFWKQIIEDGLDYHFRKNLVGYASDGGSNMKYTFFAKLCLALERTTITQVHCGNHRLELASKNSFKQEFFLKFSDEFMNKLYRF